MIQPLTIEYVAERLLKYLQSQTPNETPIHRHFGFVCLFLQTFGFFIAYETTHFNDWEENKMKKKKRKGIIGGICRCPYCGSSVTYRSADGIYKDNSSCTMLYVCSRYPKCDVYVRVHKGTNIPVGTMADRKLRQLRNEAHKHFSKLIHDDYMTKHEAYRWLAGLLGVPQKEAHIGYLSEYYCNIVIEESKKEYERYLRRNFKRSAAV